MFGGGVLGGGMLGGGVLGGGVLGGEEEDADKDGVVFVGVVTGLQIRGGGPGGTGLAQM